jgi:hypothetical protein
LVEHQPSKLRVAGSNPVARFVRQAELVIPGEPPQGGPLAANFKVSGTYQDRSLDNMYEILTDWLAR